MLTKEQIERFLKRECSVEEANSIARVLKNNPELLIELDIENEETDLDDTALTALKNRTWPSVLAAANKEAHDKYQEADHVTRNHLPKRGRVRAMKPAAWLVAASLIAAVFFGWYLLYHKNAEPISAISYAGAETEVVNHGAGTRELGLADGSCIILQPGAAISYDESGFLTNRFIKLTGDALFNVAKKDGARFRIERDELLIEVLGTRFDVKEVSNKSKIAVRLYEGKVKIDFAENAKTPGRESFYLNPGQTFYFTKATGQTEIVGAVVTGVAPKEKQVSQSGVLKGNANTSNNWYVFSNQPLSDVFDQLQAVYQQKIIYNRSDIANLYYIGKVEKTDSLHRILETIAVLNDLSVEFKNGAFQVKKK